MNAIILLLSISAITSTVPTVPERAAVDSILTVEAITKMTNFWRLQKDEPQSITLDTSTKYEQVRELYFGQVGLVHKFWGVSVAKKAAKYPSVAADLKKVDLTPEQYDLYGDMISRANFEIMVSNTAGEGKTWYVDSNDSVWMRLVPTGLEAANTAFVKAHKKELETLKDWENCLWNRVYVCPSK